MMEALRPVLLKVLYGDEYEPADEPIDYDSLSVADRNKLWIDWARERVAEAKRNGEL
jgi:hypothetical protein